MMISLLVAMDENGGIGIHNRLPWHISSDLRRFKQLTMGHHVLMGRKTYESIGRVLPGRVMLIVTNNRNYTAEGCVIFHSINDAVDYASTAGENELFIIGGGEIFAQVMPMADRIYLTRVHTRLPVDVTFPMIDWNEWSEQETTLIPAGDLDEFSTTYQVLDKKKR